MHGMLKVSMVECFSFHGILGYMRSKSENIIRGEMTGLIVVNVVECKQQNTFGRGSSA